MVHAGLWNEWMLGAVPSARSTVLASTILKPYPHQMDAVYNHMLTQPLLRFLLAEMDAITRVTPDNHDDLIDALRGKGVPVAAI